MELDGLPPGSYQQQQHHQQRQHGGQRGRGARGGQQQRQRHPEPEPGKPVEGCWFCLSSDQVCGAERVVAFAGQTGLWRLWGRGLWHLLRTAQGRAVCSWGCVITPRGLLVTGWCSSLMFVTIVGDNLSELPLPMSNSHLVRHCVHSMHLAALGRTQLR